jgi:hypothetical protein
MVRAGTAIQVRPMTTAVARDRFPVIAVAALAAVTVMAFAHTYYLRWLFDLPPLSRAAHLHGIFATLWLGLHYSQARLIAAHKVHLHKRLGIFTACVGALLAYQALSLAIANVAAGRAPPGRNPLEFLSVPIGTTSMFVFFLASALALRTKREWHKRLMLLATMALLIPAAGRFDSMIVVPLGLPRGVTGLWLTVAFVAWACWHDWRKRGRVHPAFLYGGALLIASVPLRRWIGMQEWWLPIAHWAVG